MKKYRVSELTGNEVLAKAIYLESGQILLETGTKLQRAYRESLAALNIEEIFIQDIFEKQEKPNLYFEKEVFLEFQNELQEILSHHVYKDNRGLKRVKALADKIVEVYLNTKEERTLDIRERSSDIYEHTMYTTLLVLFLAEEYGFSKQYMKDAVLGCLLHDMGHFYVNAAYENCCLEEMTPKEVFELKKHTILAYTALEKEDWIPNMSRNMILFHHEKLDGSGYPLKQKSKEPECCMIQICDAFDTAVSGMECIRQTLETAFEKISDSIKYKEDMAEILKKKIGRYPVGTLVQLSNKKEAVVISQTDNPKVPEIMYLNGKKRGLNQEEEMYILGIL